MTGFIEDILKSQKETLHYRYSNISEWVSLRHQAHAISPTKNTNTLNFNHHELQNNEQSTFEEQFVFHSSKPNILVVENKTESKASYAIFQKLHLLVKENATLDFITIHDESVNSFNVIEFNIEIEKGAEVRHWHFSLGGHKNRFNLNIHLKEENAHFEQRSMVLTTSQEHVDLHSVIHHHVKNTTSSQLVKNILSATSHGIFTGRIIISPDANQVQAKQLHRSLLMNKKAHIHSEPQLEIHAHDVKCTHGSTTGALSDEEIFYLQTRGIQPEKAQAMLSQAFALEVSMLIPDQNLKESINNRLLKKLLQMGETIV
jgi:Fe-S cluster assembly scaffold protein SufB